MEACTRQVPVSGGLAEVGGTRRFIQSGIALEAAVCIIKQITRDRVR